MLQSGISYNQILDKNGKIHYVDENKQNINSINPIQKAYRNVLANYENAKDFVNLPLTNENKKDFANNILTGELAILGGITPIRVNSKLNSAYELFFHKPFSKMDNLEKAVYTQNGKDYYKKYLSKMHSYNKATGKVDFYNAQAGEPDLEYMEQYPLLPLLIRLGKDNKNEPAKMKYNAQTGKYSRRQDATDFDNLKVWWKGKNYDYQIRNNPYLPNKDFYNIKPYELFLKELEAKERTP